MARIRTVKPEFFEDENLAKLSPHARLLFIGLFQLADKNGVLENRPAWIQSKVFPYESGEASDVSRLLPGLVLGRYLVEYTVNGRAYLAVRNFSKHQRITGKEAKSNGLHPLPPAELGVGKHQGNNGEAPGATPDAQEQGTGNREQGTGKGREGTASAATPGCALLISSLKTAKAAGAEPREAEALSEWIEWLTNDVGCESDAENAEVIRWASVEAKDRGVEMRYKRHLAKWTNACATHLKDWRRARKGAA